MVNLTVNTKKYGKITLNTKPHSDPRETPLEVNLYKGRLFASNP